MVGIKGTKQEKLWVDMGDNYLKQGEVVESYLGNMYIESIKDRGNSYRYKMVYPVMAGEELEIAVKHYKLLLKWGCIPF